MGYRCPVCDAPQADGEHLANHLAFTAMTRNDDHAAWLDEQAPGWGDDSPAELAARVVDHAEETEHEASSRSHDRSVPRQQGTGRSPSAGTGSRFDGVVDAAVERVLDDARELTEEMFEPDDDSPGGEPIDDDPAGKSDGDTGSPGDDLGTPGDDPAAETQEE